MRKYTVFSRSLKQYYRVYNGKGLYYDDSCFSLLDDARQYKSEDGAIKMALQLYKDFDTVVMPIDIVPDMTDEVLINEIIEKQCAEYLPNVLLIDALDDNEVEELPIKRWNEYKQQRSYLRTYCEDYK